MFKLRNEWRRSLCTSSRLMNRFRGSGKRKILKVHETNWAGGECSTFNNDMVVFLMWNPFSIIYSIRQNFVSMLILSFCVTKVSLKASMIISS